MKTFRLKEIQKIINEDEKIGYCIECGEKEYGIDHEASEQECNHCGKKAISGSFDIIIRNLITEFIENAEKQERESAKNGNPKIVYIDRD